MIATDFITRNHWLPVIARGCLFAFGTMALRLSEQLGESLADGATGLSGLKWIMVLAGCFGSGAIATIAFMDGSTQRKRDEIADRHHHGS